MKHAHAIALERSREDSARPRGAPSDAARPFALCEVFTELEDARAPWEELEACAIATPYQRLSFLKAWIATIGRGRQITPFIVVARDAAGQLSALLPFAATRVGPFHIAEFLGGKDSNFNMALFRPGLTIDRSALVDLLRRAAAFGSPPIAGFLCLNQPADWQGAINPMAILGGQASPSYGYKSSLGDDYVAWLNAHYSRDAHKKLRKKAQRLNAVGPVSHSIARDSASAKAILAAFAAQKDARMRELGLTGSWDRDRTLAFLARASLASPDAAPLELHALSCGERIVAVFGGLPGADRFCGMFISYEPDPPIARCSPGEILLNEVVRDLIGRRFATLDLGVGALQGALLRGRGGAVRCVRADQRGGASFRSRAAWPAADQTIHQAIAAAVEPCQPAASRRRLTALRRRARARRCWPEQGHAASREPRRVSASPAPGFA